MKLIEELCLLACEVWHLPASQDPLRVDRLEAQTGIYSAWQQADAGQRSGVSGFPVLLPRTHLNPCSIMHQERTQDCMHASVDCSNLAGQWRRQQAAAQEAAGPHVRPLCRGHSWQVATQSLIHMRRAAAQAQKRHSPVATPSRGHSMLGWRHAPGTCRQGWRACLLASRPATIAAEPPPQC